MSCDLLKIHYLCGRNDNKPSQFTEDEIVVICSKFITFVVEMTTSKKGGCVRLSCDLLKIHYLCGRNDNLRIDAKNSKNVVICSKFITFVVEMTTISGKRLRDAKL